MKNMDVIAQLGKTAGFNASGQRFYLPSDNMDVIATVAERAASLLEKQGGPNLSWLARNMSTTAANRAGIVTPYVAPAAEKSARGLLSRPVLRTVLGAGAGGTAGFAAGMSDSDASGWDVAKRTGLGAGLGAGAANVAFSPGARGAMAKGFTRAGATAADPRRFSLGRSALTGTGLALGGGIAAGHAMEDAHYSAGGSNYNPLRWAGGQSEAQAWQRNQDAYHGATQGLRNDIQSAISSGDHEKADKLQAQLATGPGNGWRLGGLNPLATNPRYHRDQAMGIQGKVQGRYDKEMANVGAQPGDYARIDQMRGRLRGGEAMMPAQRQAMQSQLSALEGRSRMDPGQETGKARSIATSIPGMQLNRQTPANFSGGVQSNNFNGRPGGPVPYDYTRNGRGIDWSVYAQH